MHFKHTYILLMLAFSTITCLAKEKRGADIPWTTYEAESMKTNGTVLGPTFDPFQVETESSGQKCVKLTSEGQYLEFASTIQANSLVVRYSLPDNTAGTGKHSTLAIYKNGKLLQQHSISSAYSRLYGIYPFTNNAKDGKPRNFYDEMRLTGIQIEKGDIIRIQRADRKEDDAEYCIIDLVDLENVTPPLQAPDNSLSITDKSFRAGNAPDDYTEAFRKCIAQAAETGKSVWIPAGTFKITGDILLPANVTIQGAGMWHSTLIGDEKLYSNQARRVRLKGNGDNITLADFAIMGKLNYRSDQEPNDGIVGSFGTNSTISRLWIEHTKVGIWVENSKNLQVEGCRFRNTLADGINFCVGMTQSTMQNCTARGTGDDCFAIWPAVFSKQQFSPGYNLITHCTAQLPFLANGVAIYGGESNKVANCLITDISPGSAILISTTFPTESKEKGLNNNFSGTTVVEDCDIKTSGGFDHTWDWRAAVEVVLDKRNISGIELNNLTIENSISTGVSIITSLGNVGTLTNATLTGITISNYGIGTQGKNALFIAPAVSGCLTIQRSTIPDTNNASDDFTLVQKDK